MTSSPAAVSYYPGCSLEASARDFDASIRAVSGALGIELRELNDWNCCGASAAHAASPELALGLAARNLVLAEEAGRDLVVPCASCFQRLKSAEHELLSGRRRAEAAIHFSYRGRVRVWDFLEFMAQEAVIESVRPKLSRPLTGLKAVCYYGCLTQRPPRVTGVANPENPGSMDALVETVGATALPWSYKTDCCGASLALARPELVKTLARRLYERALECGAECIVVACQMCQANLDLRQAEVAAEAGSPFYLPVIYFTELMGLAMGLEGTTSWLSRHLVDPRPLLRGKGLL